MAVPFTSCKRWSEMFYPFLFAFVPAINTTFGSAARHLTPPHALQRFLNGQYKHSGPVFGSYV